VNKRENQCNMYLYGMKQVPKLNLSDFDYHLPNESIAYTPTANRAESKLLVWDKQIKADSIYENITDFIPSNSALFFNNSKVIAARILFEKNNENVDHPKSVIEIFCLEPSLEYSPVQLAMQATSKVQWICLVGGVKKWKTELLEKQIKYGNKIIHFYARKINSLDGKFLIEFSWDDDAIIFSEILALIGQIPLPPYIERNVNELDKERYQTTYASEEGSVAAPTAGLHFSKALLDKISAHQIDQQFITLHVGAGTFLPVKTEIINEHPMHAEFFEIDQKTIQYLIENKNDFIAVGTTTLRTLESIFWLGVKALNNPQLQPSELHLSQWEAYTFSDAGIDRSASLTALSGWMEKNKLNTLISKTQLMILPGYHFKIAKGLITNFHQPKSTLLLIIAAIVGDQWKEIYQYALDKQYRFLSYGDGCLFQIPSDLISGT